MSASRSGHESIMRLLLSHGAKQELHTSNGLTAVHWAVHDGQSGVVELLCAAPGAVTALAMKTDVVNGSCTPLALAIQEGHAACEAVLRAHGAPE